MNRAILNVAVGGSYPAKQDRLAASLDAIGETAQRMLWSAWPGRSHAEVPYGFKIDAFDHAVEHGIDQALWLDSPLVAVKSLRPAWDVIDRDHVLLLDDGATWNCGQWTSDAALEYFGISRDEACEIPHLYACVVGIDLSSTLGVQFRNRWAAARSGGVFQGARKNDTGQVSADPRCLGHRWDQSAASLVAWQMGLPLQDVRDFVLLTDDGDPVFRSIGKLA